MTMPSDPGSEHLEPPLNPIVLGVTGHVNPRPGDRKALKAALREILSDFRLRYPHTPLVVLSSLARGGDQLAVGVALAQGARVIAPLPFPHKVYAQSTSFEGDDPARERFLEWVSHPFWKGKIRPFVVHHPDEPDANDLAGWTALMTDRHKRHECYANSGSYILRHCHALIAFWDGKPSPRPSGTAEVVVCKRHGQTLKLDPWRARFPLLNADADGPVYVIHTPRTPNADAPAADSAAPDPYQPGSWRVLTPNAKVPVSESDLKWELGSLHRFVRRVGEAMTLHPHGAHHPHKAKHVAESHPDAVKAEVRRARAEFRQFHETCQTIDDFNHDAAVHARSIAHRLAKLPESELGADTAGMSIPEPLIRRCGSCGRRRDGLEVRLVFHLLPGRPVHNPILCSIMFSRLCSSRFRRSPRRSLPDLAVGVRGIAVAAPPSAVLGLGTAGERASARLPRAGGGPAGSHLLGAGRDRQVCGRQLYEPAPFRDVLDPARALQCVSPAPAYWNHLFRDKSLEEQIALLQLVGRQWVDRQRDYFLDKFHDNHKDAVWLHRIGIAVAFSGWLIAAVLVGTNWTKGDSPEPAPVPAESARL